MPRRILHLKCVPTQYGGHRCYRVYPGFRGSYAVDYGFLLYTGFGTTVAEAYADFWRINCKFMLPHFRRLLGLEPKNLSLGFTSRHVQPSLPPTRAFRPAAAALQ